MENVIIREGKTPGKTSVILVGVHGNETCGIQALEEILPRLEIEKGTVYFIYGNPRAIEQGVRYTETNLNRLFRDDNLINNQQKNTYEYCRSKEIIKYLDQADALLDIHASNTPNSIPFIICEDNSTVLTNQLIAETIVSGFDKLEPGGSDGYMNSQGKIGICLECGFIKEKKSINIAKRNIYQFLKIQEHVTGQKELFECHKKKYNMEYIYHTQTDNFKLTKEFKDFEEVEKDQVVGFDGNIKVTAPNTGIILFARNRQEKGSEAFLWGIKKVT